MTELTIPSHSSVIKSGTLKLVSATTSHPSLVVTTPLTSHSTNTTDSTETVTAEYELINSSSASKPGQTYSVLEGRNANHQAIHHAYGSCNHNSDVKIAVWEQGVGLPANWSAWRIDLDDATSVTGVYLL